MLSLAAAHFRQVADHMMLTFWMIFILAGYLSSFQVFHNCKNESHCPLKFCAIVFIPSILASAGRTLKFTVGFAEAGSESSAIARSIEKARLFSLEPIARLSQVVLSSP